MDKELLLTIEIPNYIRKIKLSDSRRAKYWIKSKVLAGKQKLPKKYLTEVPFDEIDLDIITMIDKTSKLSSGESSVRFYKLNLEICYWKQHKLSGKKFEFRLTDDATDEYIVKNTKVAGTESWHVINSQGVTNHTVSPFTNGKVVKALHEEVEKAIKRKFTEQYPKITTFPIRILMELHDYISDEITKHNDWDVQNRCDVWGKAFVDCLTELEIIPDDHRAYVTQPPVPLYCPFPVAESPGDELVSDPFYYKPKLVFKIYADRRPSLESLTIYRKGKKIKKPTKQSSRKR